MVKYGKVTVRQELRNSGALEHGALLTSVKNKKICPFCFGNVPFLTLNDAVIYTFSHVKYINYLLKIYKN